MKVLLINAVCGIGSTGNIVVEIAQELKNQGHEAKIAFGLGKAKKIDKEDTIKFNCQLGYYWHNIISRFTDHTGLYSIPQTKYLIRKIKQYNPDVIHLHNLHGYYVNYKILFEFLKQYEKPVVWTLHDCWAFTGHCTHFVSANCEQWKEHCKKCTLLRRYPKCYTKGDVKYNFKVKKESFTGVGNMTVVTPSKWLGDIANQSFLNEYQIKTITNGIDTSIFCYRNSGLKSKYAIEGKKIILGVANVWNEKKGLKDFCLLSEQLDDRYQIVLVGLTESQKVELPSQIIGISRTNNQVELAEIYSAADVFVNPTYEESFGLTTLEAQACGTPAIVYNTGGCPETIYLKKSRLVSCGDINALKNEIEKVVSSSKDQEVVGKEVFSKEKTYAEYLKLYTMITKKNKSANGSLKRL